MCRRRYEKQAQTQEGPRKGPEVRQHRVFLREIILNGVAGRGRSEVQITGQTLLR